MAMTGRIGDTSDAGAAALAAFCALLLDDLALQTQLRQPDCADESTFLARLLDVARQRGFAFTADDARHAMRERMLALDGVPAAAVTETPPPPDGWLPIRTFWQAGALYAHWAYFGARRLRAPFFEGDVRGCLTQPFNRLVRYVTAVDKLGAWLAERPHLQPGGFIFHMSRCGSTLVAQMLAAVESNIVVAEASPIDGVVQAQVQAQVWKPDLGDERQDRWLRAIVGALGQQRGGDERRYFIKLDCWHSVALPLFRRAFPAVPWIFLYRDPVEVMMSQLAMPGAQMLPHGVGPNFHGIARAYGPGTAEDYYAQVLAKICEPVAAHFGQGGGLLVNYRELPEAVFSKILPHFGVAPGAAARAAMTAAARFDAKAPGFAFAPDSAAKQQAASPAARAAAARWLGEVYERLEAMRGAAPGAAVRGAQRESP
jgi:hypothetical protein